MNFNFFGLIQFQLIIYVNEETTIIIINEIAEVKNYISYLVCDKDFLIVKLMRNHEIIESIMKFQKNITNVFCSFIKIIPSTL